MIPCFSRLKKVRSLLPTVVLPCLVAMIFILAPEKARAGWQLTWSDEFNSNSVNPNNWTFETGNGCPGNCGWGNNELEYYTSRPQNVYVTNGLLHIVAQQESYAGYNYTSAKLETVGLFSQAYGRFEFYAKLPPGQGYWPALWMMPEDSVYGGWAASGEIDVMENQGSNPTNVLGTIHYGGMYPNQTQSYGPSFNFPAGDSVTNFHQYALEWTNNAIRWYVDNQLYETQTSWWSSSNPTNTNIRNPYPAPFDQPFYIIMNLAVGGNFGGNPDGTTVFPGDMQVDYVRAYTWVSSPPPPPVLQLSVPFTDPSGSTTTPSDISSNGVNVTLQMVNGAGTAADLHGTVNSGVGGAATGIRALDLTSNGTSQPGNPGPMAAVTNASLGFGIVSNFTVSIWFKQNAAMAQGANVGPRLFVLGGGTPNDTGAANSIGMKFQTASQLYFQLGGTTLAANFTNNLPTNVWLFCAATYDGANLMLYEGTESNSVSLVGTASVTTTVNFGVSGELLVGNQQARQRSFNGWINDFRFYTGTGDSNFVENLREQALPPPPAPPAPQAYTPPVSERADVSLDANWQFIRQDVAGAQTNGFNDSSWTNLNLPHTWNNLDGQDGGNNYYRGIGWYRSHVTPGASYTNQEFFLKFDGAFSVADVWVNGNYLGEHQGGFAAFVYDVTPYLNVGADNVIAVKVNNSFNTNIPPLAADFTFFGGLYRDVHLLVTDPVQISPLDYGSPGVYLTTTSVSSNSANLQVTAVVSNSTASAQPVMVRAVVTDAATNIVAVLTNTVSLPPMTTSNVQFNTVIVNPHLWNGLPDPYLYQGYVELWRSTNVVDLVAQPLGFRWFSVDPTNGFFLNGRHYDLHGVNMHQDWLNCGWALTNAQRDTNFLFLKEIGATFLRLSHYEHNDYTYQLADQDGICLWSEIPLIDYITTSAAFTTNTLQQLREMIRQRYNHPSVMFWSIYNEITLDAGPSTTNLISQEVPLVNQEDPTRLTTAAANTSDGDPSTFYTQVIAFNKYYGWYSSPLNGIAAWADNIHSNYPGRCVGVSEYGAGASIYQHSENPTFPANTSTSFHPEEWQDIVDETNWQLMAARPFLWCKMVWTSFDFASDGRNEGDTPGRNDKGLVTYDRQTRKDTFYFYKANWTTNPMVYITGHTFTNRLTNQIIAKVYANCDSVELFVNGSSQGSVTSTNCIYTWPAVLFGGTNSVLAIGTKGGIQVTDSLAWMAPASPPAIAIVNPALPTLYLASTNVVLALTATATDFQPASPPAMTTAWSQTGGPGAITFGNGAALSTTAAFSTKGVYGLQIQAIKGSLVSSAGLTVVVGNVPYGPMLNVRFPFDDTGSGTTTSGDTSGGGVNVSLQMLNQNGGTTNLHGAANSGVAGWTNPNRALNLSMNPNQGISGGASGNFAAVTNSTLGFGSISNFITTMWMKQLYLLPANFGPRMFIFGNSTNSDCGTANSIGMKFQDGTNLDFFVNTIQAQASFGSALPTNTWVYLAMVYDQTNVSLYEGTDVTPAALISVTPATGQTVPMGSAASLYIGNRPDRARCFAGWIDDFRFYTGQGDLSLVESVRQSAAGPAGLTATPGNNQVNLAWNPLPGATSYNIKRSNVSGGPYAVISIAGMVTGMNYVDGTVTNGGTYYYVVSAATSISTASETANSPTEAIAVLPPPPSPPVASYNSPLYAGMTLNLAASTISGAAYGWSGPNGFSSTSQNPSLSQVSQNASGTYNVTATVGGLTSAPGAVSVVVNPPLVFTVQSSASGIVLNWPYGTLQSATNLSGPWNNVPGVVSPFTNSPIGSQQFYRIRLQ